MRVLFNGASTIRLKTGVGHTTLNLHRALCEASPSDRFWLYPGDLVRGWASRLAKPSTRPTGSVSPPKPKAKLLHHRLALQAARLGYELHFRTAARFGKFDLYHEPNLIPFDVRLPTVVTIHDLSVILHPEWHPAERVKRYERAFQHGAEKAAHILVDSESVRSEVIQHLGLRPERVSTVHMGIGENFCPQSSESIEAVRFRTGLPDRYLLYVGTVEPRKNLSTLLRAYCDLPGELRASCPLVIGGSWGWKSEAERQLFEGEARDKGVRYLGYIADDDLPALYAGALALLYPSFYEGFGLPPVEAMACGTPAIVSTADAVREVVGAQALLIDPADLSGWRDALKRTVSDADYLAEYRLGAVSHAAQFRWKRSATTTLSVYRRVLAIAQSDAKAPSVRAA